MYAYQLIGGFFLAHTLVRLENYQIYCMICATAQIEILAERMKKIGYNEKDHREDVRHHEQYLLECMNFHKHIMR